MNVTIHEGQQLAGLNIDPVVKVQIGEDVKYTSIKQSTNCPYFDEVRLLMLYNGKMKQQSKICLSEKIFSLTDRLLFQFFVFDFHETPMLLFDKMLTLHVRTNPHDKDRRILMKNRRVGDEKRSRTRLGSVVRSSLSSMCNRVGHYNTGMPQVV